jgi:hypothetical protein
MQLGESRHQGEPHVNPGRVLDRTLTVLDGSKISVIAAKDRDRRSAAG